VRLQTANKKAADDQIAGDLAIAKAKHQTANEVALLRQQQQGLNKDSLEYKQLEASIITAEEQGSKKKKAGGTKISDQQKLNNTLQADQVAADNKADDQESKHLDAMMQIQLDFYDKMHEAQRAFDLDERQEREGFYEKLASIEDHGLQQAMSAKFEAATLKAQEIAKTKGADAGDAYLKAAQSAIEKEGSLQAEIDKASNKKDKKTYDPQKAEYYTGLLKMQQAADAEQLKQIEENGSAIANAKDKALADEADKNTAAQDKIATAAERTSDRQITAAAAAGKKIDENTARLERQKGVYDTIAPSGASTPASPAGGSSAGASTTTTAPSADPVADALNGLRDAIAAVERATKSAGDQVAGAVRSAAGGRLAA